jgi:hypothetical protein
MNEIDLFSDKGNDSVERLNDNYFSGRNAELDRLAALMPTPPRVAEPQRDNHDYGFGSAIPLSALSLMIGVGTFVYIFVAAPEHAPMGVLLAFGIALSPVVLLLIWINIKEDRADRKYRRRMEATGWTKYRADRASWEAEWNQQLSKIPEDEIGMYAFVNYRPWP